MIDAVTPTELGRTVFLNLSGTHKANIAATERRWQTQLPIEKFTCCNCDIVDKCEFAYDLYNLDGDCLAEK